MFGLVDEMLVLFVWVWEWIFVICVMKGMLFDVDDFDMYGVGFFF